MREYKWWNRDKNSKKIIIFFDGWSWKEKKITLSIPVETNGKLEELAQKYGMTKSGLVNFLVNQVAEAGTIYRQ